MLFLSVFLPLLAGMAVVSLDGSSDDTDGPTPETSDDPVSDDVPVADDDTPTADSPVAEVAGELFVGTEGDDTLLGTEGGDTIEGRAGETAWMVVTAMTLSKVKLETMRSLVVMAWMCSTAMMATTL